jgi:hypothetical protein
MNKAPSGYYRQLLTNFPMVRIAFTHTPIIGCSRVDSTEIIKILETSDDEYASYYVNGLKSGSMVTIVEGNPDRYFEVGELYFKS